ISLDKCSEVYVTEIMTPVNDLVIMDKNDRADEALRQMYQRNINRVYVGSDHHKYKMINGLFKNKLGTNRNRNSDTIQQSPYILLPGYEQSFKVKLEGIISKSDLLNLARNDKRL
ncbi:MAG: hypothetical protein M3Y25_00890, partial [Thermoproteota archaeon]|nr:hypothetical protein [Thermoproteota archaeon]